MWERIQDQILRFAGAIKYPALFFLLILALYLSYRLNSATVSLANDDDIVYFSAGENPSGRSGGGGNDPEAGNKRIKASSAQEPKNLVVSITGSVQRPGVYELAAGSILQNLLDAAGGVKPDADNYYISVKLNLAEELKPHQQIYIPSKKEQKLLELIQGQPQSSGNSNSAVAVGKINLNKATNKELETLPGIGSATAEKIVAARPFKSVDDLKEVSGIGEATFAKLKDLVEV